MFVVMCFSCLFFFKQKTAYEMRISDWSSDVCSSDLQHPDDDRGEQAGKRQTGDRAEFLADDGIDVIGMRLGQLHLHRALAGAGAEQSPRAEGIERTIDLIGVAAASQEARSEEHTSELQSLMRNSYAVFCLKKK